MDMVKLWNTLLSIIQVYVCVCVLQKSSMMWRFSRRPPRRRRRRKDPCLRSAGLRSPRRPPAWPPPASHASGSTHTRKTCWPRWTHVHYTYTHGSTRTLCNLYLRPISLLQSQQYFIFLICFVSPGIWGHQQMGAGYFQNSWILWESSSDSGHVLNFSGTVLILENISLHLGLHSDLNL